MQFTVTNALLFTVASLSAQTFARPTPQEFYDYDVYDYGYDIYDSPGAAYGYDYDDYGYAYTNNPVEYSGEYLTEARTLYAQDSDPFVDSTVAQNTPLADQPRAEVAIKDDRSVVTNDRFQTPAGSSSPLNPTASGFGINDGTFSGLFNGVPNVPDFSNLFSPGFATADNAFASQGYAADPSANGFATGPAPGFARIDRQVAAANSDSTRAGDTAAAANALRNDGHEQFNDQVSMARNDVDDGAAAQRMNREGAIGARRGHAEAGSFELLFGFDKGCKYDKGFGYTRSYGEDNLHDDVASFAGLDNRVANRLGSNHRDAVATTAMDEADATRRFGSNTQDADALNSQNRNAYAVNTAPDFFGGVGRRA